MSADRTPAAVRRFTVLTIVYPIAVTVVALVIQLLLFSRLPGMVAIHWTIDGPDGFAPAWLQPVIAVLMGAGVPLLIAGSALSGLRRGDRGGSYRLVGAVAAGVATLAAVLFVWSSVIQAGLSDAAQAPSIAPGLLVAAAAAGAVGVAGWFWQPAETAQVSARPVSALPLAEGEQAAWFAGVAVGRGALTAVSAACILVLAIAAAAWAGAASLAAAVLLTVSAVILIALAASTTAFRVCVDADGITVASVVGVPRFRVPVGDIAAVDVVDVNPMGEFGGYGIRSTPGRFGVVLRRGEAIEVTRRGGKRFVVTVPDAATGAALLAAVAERAGTPA